MSEPACVVIVHEGLKRKQTFPLGVRIKTKQKEEVSAQVVFMVFCKSFESTGHNSVRPCSDSQPQSDFRHIQIVS